MSKIDPKNASLFLQVESELIQLTDIITSSVAQALPASGNQTKIYLGELVGTWIQDTHKLPWEQEKELHRCFSLSCFPDENGRLYNPMLVVNKPNQPSLFPKD